MSSIRQFYERMSPSDSDRFAAVLQRLNSESSAKRLEQLEESLSDVRDSLDRVNAERARLRSSREDLAVVLRRLDEEIATGCATELVQLKLILLQEDAKLEELFAQTRPDHLHEEKAKLRKEIAERRLLGRLTGMILGEAKQAHGD